MTATTPDSSITWSTVSRRAIRKLSRKGVLRGLIQLQRLSNDQRDSFPAALQRAAEKYSDTPGIKFEGRTWTWQQVNEQANQYARALRTNGVRKGDTVAVAVPNRPGMLFALMGVLKLGAIAALQNTELVGEVLAHSLDLVKPTALIVGEEQLPAVASLPQVPKTYADILFYISDAGLSDPPEGFADLAVAAAVAGTENLRETAEITFGDEAIYIYTSGTTGLPKATVQPHRRMAMGGLFAGRVMRELTPADTVYCPMPLYHGTALLGGWAACVYTGAAFVPARRFSVSRFWDEIREYDVTSFNYSGEMLRYLLNERASLRDREHRVKMVTGVGLRAEMWTPFKERFGVPHIFESYGSSESPAGFMNIFNFECTSGWLPLGWRAIRWDVEAEAPYRGENGMCKRVKKGEVGLLVFRLGKHQTFDGYTDPVATQSKYLTDVAKKGDRWFNTGDLVMPQGCGHMRFVDRTGDTFRWKGENVATTQVEAVIDKWPQISEAIVYGVRVPGSEGRCGMARVILHPGEELDLRGLADHLRKELPRYAVPRFLRLGRDVELTGTFKHRKGPLKDQGFDLEQIEEPVLVLATSDPQWRELTPEITRQIAAGEVRL